MNLKSAISKKKILVVGDVMLDTYYLGKVKRISPEAPVPVFKKESERSVLGGAANVAANLVAAKQDVYMLGAIGDDDAGRTLLLQLEKVGVSTEFMIHRPYSTTVKTRFVANNNQQVMRLDVEDIIPLDEIECQEVLKSLENKISEFDLVVFSDYLKGVMTEMLTQGIISLANTKNVKCIIDVKDTNVDKYKNAYLLKPNLNELRMLTGHIAKSDEEIIEATHALRKRCNCDYVLTTCGVRGMVLVGNEGFHFIESVGKEVFDVTGAGDTTISYLAACMANKMPMKKSVEIANVAAGIQVGKMGTSAVRLGEVAEKLTRDNSSFEKKIFVCESVEDLVKNLKGKSVVFTNGCFDILHVGHVKYLKESASFGDVLVVGLNSDDSVRRLKGPERPINTQSDRAELLASLESVDYIVIFDEDTPYELIKAIQPDVLVKGGDYMPDEVVGKDIVEAKGGRLELIPFVEGKSTTNIINKVRE